LKSIIEISLSDYICFFLIQQTSLALFLSSRLCRLITMFPWFPVLSFPAEWVGAQSSKSSRLLHKMLGAEAGLRLRGVGRAVGWEPWCAPAQIIPCQPDKEGNEQGEASARSPM
jgi:hypothetical protein